MNRKSFILTLLLALVLIGLTGAHRLASASAGAPIDGLNESAATADDTVELTFSFKVRIRLPLIKKDAI